MQNIQEKIADYTAALKVQGTAWNTIASYKRDLCKMADYLVSEGCTDCSQITEQKLRAYLRRMKEENRQPSTIARATASMKAFFRYLEQNREIVKNPAEQLKAPKVEKSIPHILTPEETVRLLQQPQGDTVKAVRDRAMLELLYATGLRVSELLQLQTGDINLAMEYLVCSQGARERVIPFGRTAKRALQKYLEEARPKLVKDSSCKVLFTNLSGQKMSRQGFGKLLRQYARDAGIKGEITPHTLRHSFAAHLVHNGADLYAVQEMMGYADLAAAQVYAKMHRVSLREVYTKAHPRENENP